MLRTHVLLCEAFLAHDVYLCIKRPSKVTPVILHGVASPDAEVSDVKTLSYNAQRCVELRDVADAEEKRLEITRRCRENLEKMSL